MEDCDISVAVEKDAESICDMIQELAVFENMPEGPKVDGEALRAYLKNGVCHGFIVRAGASKQVIGYTLYFYAYSSANGPFIFLEDLYVRPEFRGQCIGKSLLLRIAQLCLEQKLCRMEWHVLDWNQRAMKFYHSLGAEDISLNKKYRVFRLTKTVMNALPVLQNPPLKAKNASYNVLPAAAQDAVELCAAIKDLNVSMKNENGLESGEPKLTNGPNLEQSALVKDFEEGRCFGLVARTVDEGILLGYGLYYNAYSTWEGSFLFLEDIYVIPQFRRQGIGKSLFLRAVQMCVEKKLPRLQWNVLSWNQAAMDFFKTFGAVDLMEKEGWHLYRLNSSALTKLSPSINS